MKSRSAAMSVRAGFTILEVAVAVLVLGLFALCVWPAAREARERRHLKDTLAQGTQLWAAIMAANRVGDTSAQARAIWPTSIVYRSSTEYFKALFSTNRLGADAPMHLLAAPGMPVWTGTLASLTESNVAWCVARCDGVSSNTDFPLLFTRNLVGSRAGDSLTDMDSLDPNAKPFGRRGAVVVTSRGNVRLVEQRGTNDNLQLAFNPYRYTNAVLKTISMKRVAPPPEQPAKQVGAISGKPLNAPPVWSKKAKKEP